MARRTIRILGVIVLAVGHVALLSAPRSPRPNRRRRPSSSCAYAGPKRACPRAGRDCVRAPVRAARNLVSSTPTTDPPRPAGRGRPPTTRSLHEARCLVSPHCSPACRLRWRHDYDARRTTGTAACTRPGRSLSVPGVRARPAVRWQGLQERARRGAARAGQQGVHRAGRRSQLHRDRAGIGRDRREALISRGGPVRPQVG